MSYAARRYAGHVACWAGTSVGIMATTLLTVVWACKKYLPSDRLASVVAHTVGRPWLRDDAAAGVLIWAALLYAMLSSAPKSGLLSYRIAWTYVDALMLLTLLLMVLWVFRLASMFGGDGAISFNPAKEWLLLPARAPLCFWAGTAVVAAAAATLLALVTSAFFRRVRTRGDAFAAQDAALMYPIHSTALLGTPFAIAAVGWAVLTWPRVLRFLKWMELIA